MDTAEALVMQNAECRMQNAATRRKNEALFFMVWLLSYGGAMDTRARARTISPVAIVKHNAETMQELFSR
jgi:hypothetical protein